MKVDRSEYQKLSGSQEININLEDVSGTDKECPNNNLKMSLVALLCCFPCGIVALYHSMRVKRLYSMGKTEEAIYSSERAELCSRRVFAYCLMFCICQILLFLAGLVLLICFTIDSRIL